MATKSWSLSLRDLFSATGLVGLNKRVNVVLNKLHECGFEVKRDSIELNQALLHFYAPLKHKDSGRQVEGRLSIHLTTGEVTFDSGSWNQARALRVSYKKRLTVRNMLIKWLLKK